MAKSFSMSKKDQYETLRKLGSALQRLVEGNVLEESIQERLEAAQPLIKHLEGISFDAILAEAKATAT